MFAQGFKGERATFTLISVNSKTGTFVSSRIKTLKLYLVKSFNNY